MCVRACSSCVLVYSFWLVLGGVEGGRVAGSPVQGAPSLQGRGRHSGMGLLSSKEDPVRGRVEGYAVQHAVYVLWFRAS